MATKLRKTIEREISDWNKRGLFGFGGGRSNRDLIVSMEVGNIFSFREKGLRKKYYIDMESVYNMAIKADALGEIKEQKKKKSKKVERYGW